MSTPKPPPKAAAALTMFRVLPNGEGRAYTVAEASEWQVIEHSIRMARAIGYLNDDDREGDYAVLDVLDADGSIIHDYVIPHARAARWWYRHLGLRVDPPGSWDRRPNDADVPTRA